MNNLEKKAWLCNQIEKHYNNILAGEDFDRESKHYIKKLKKLYIYDSSSDKHHFLHYISKYEKM